MAHTYNVTLEELMVSTLAMTDALAKLIENGVITDAEFKAKLNTERANYMAVLKHFFISSRVSE